MNVDFKSTRLLLTDPSAIVPAFQSNIDEVIFESYGFEALNLTAGW